jgi:hypothetical protein
LTENPSIVWTQQHRYLWTGRIDGMPAGTIERGSRFTFIDAQGAEHHGFLSLEAAQDAAESSVPEGSLA